MNQTLAICTLLCFAPWAQVLAQAESVLDDQAIFDRNRLLEVEIELPAEDWDRLRRQSRQIGSALMKPPPPSPYSYFKGNVTINGKRIEGVGLRKKGFIGSQDEERPSLKIKFDEFEDQAPIDGVDRLTLNNNKQDRALVSQTMTYKLFEDAGLPASRCNLAKVTVNGKYLGIYSNVESVKKPMLKRVFGDDTGKLYEGTLADFFVDRIDDFESKLKDETGRDELLALAKLLDSKDDLDVDALAEHIDIDEFLRFWALESLIDFWDGYTNNQNNFFVYHNPSDGKLHFLPWGADASMLNSPMYRQFQKGPESVHGQAMLANRLYATAGYPERYRQTLNELLDEVWVEKALLKEVDRLETLVADHVHESQRDLNKAMNDTRKFIKQRRDALKREMTGWPLKIAAKPRLPFHTAKVGSAVGTFTTQWTKKEPKDPYTGEAELELTIDGEPVEFTKLGVHSTRGTWPGPDGKKPPTVVFVGKRASNGIRLTLAISTSEVFFQPDPGASISAQGLLIEGAPFMAFLNPKKLRMAGGTVSFDQAGLEEGDVVQGKMQVDIVQFKGDMPR